MKHCIALLLFSVFAVSVATAQFKDVPKVEKPTLVDDVENVKPDTGPFMEFERMDVDYGTIAHNSEPLRKLPFTNTGTEPLVIKNARGSCGCTVPLWPKEPILPGQTEYIEIRYATNRVGAFSKKVTLTTNEAQPTHVLKVHGKVLKDAEIEAVPEAAPSIFGGKDGKG